MSDTNRIPSREIFDFWFDYFEERYGSFEANKRMFVDKTCYEAFFEKAHGKVSDLPTTHQKVFMHMIQFTIDGKISIGYKDLAKYTGVSVRSVAFAIKDLVARGLIEITSKGIGRGVVNVYRIP